MVKTTETKTEPHLEKFERFERETAQPSWLYPLRKSGIARFAELGFPTINQEDWRFTNVTPIAKLPFKPALQPATNGLSRQSLEQYTFATLSACRLVFVDGHYVADLSSPGNQDRGIIVCNLAQALVSNTELVQKHLARYVAGEGNAFAALNTAFFADGAIGLCH